MPAWFTNTASSLWDLDVKFNGKTVPLSDFSSAKATIVVNVASA